MVTTSTLVAREPATRTRPPRPDSGAEFRWQRVSAGLLLLTGCATESGEPTATLTSPLSWTNVVGRITADGMQTETFFPLNDLSTHHGNLLEDSRAYKVVEEKPIDGIYYNTRHEPISSLVVHRDLDNCPQSADHSCLSFTGWESDYPGKVDRIEVQVADEENPDCMQLGAWRYFRFDLKIERNTVDPSLGDSNVNISQMWQSHSGPAWKLPALAIELRGRAPGVTAPDETLSLHFTAQNDDGGIDVYDGAIVPGTWSRWFIVMKPNPLPVAPASGPIGAIMIWRDKPLDWVPTTVGNPPLNSLRELYWGYRPTPPGAESPVTSKLVTRVGIYRNGSDAKLVRFKMDNIKLTTDEANLPGP